MKKSLVLTGMMGSGKSTIGKSLSERLNFEFADTDSIIENRILLSVSEIFKIKGEKFFREIEVEESLKLVEKKGIVIALGGGAFLNSKVREKVKKTCFSVWLSLSIDELFRRTQNNQKRPLLKDNNNKEKLVEIYNQREKIYSLADYKIDCNSKNKNEIVKKIIEVYENK